MDKASEPLLRGEVSSYQTFVVVLGINPTTKEPPGRLSNSSVSLHVMHWRRLFRGYLIFLCIDTGMVKIVMSLVKIGKLCFGILKDLMVFIDYYFISATSRTVVFFTL